MNVETAVGSAVFERISVAIYGSRRSVGEVIATHHNNFNIVRFILAASVIYFHSSHIAGSAEADWITRYLLLPVTDLGGMAVQCFFFLSGLFVTQSIVKDRNLLDYVIKRAMRIFPGLFVCTVVMTPLLAMLAGWGAFSRLFRTPEPYTFMLANASLNLRWTLPTVLAGNPHAVLNGSIHTLPTELKMYVMLGLLGLLCVTSRQLWVGAVTLLIMIIAACVGPTVTAIWHTAPDTYAMIMMFLAGMLTFALANHVYVNFAQGLVLLLLILLCKQFFLFRCVATYGFVIWLMLYVGQSQSLHRLFNPRYDTSYGVYVYGWPSQQLVKALVPQAGTVLITTMGLLLAFAFALVSWIYIERPAMNVARTISGRPDKLRATLAVISWGRGNRALCIQLAALAMLVGLAALTVNVELIHPKPLSERIVGWGPTQSRVGHGFNVQPDGSSALWVKLDGEAPAGSKVVLDGHWLRTDVTTDPAILTALVPKWLVYRQGRKHIEVYVLDAKAAYRSNSVNLDIVK